MKKSIKALLVVVLFASIHTQSIAQKLVSSAGKFSVKFPCLYEESVSEGSEQTTYKFTCEKNGQTYFIGYSLHRIEMKGHEDLAQVSVDSFIEAVQGDLTSQWEWKIANASGLKTLISVENGETLIDYRVVLIGQIQYQVVVLAAKNEYDQKAAGKFQKSFKIQK